MPAEISSYHAHIYYDPATTRHIAETLRAQIAERFSVRLGRWHDAPVGPHPRAMFQVAILPEVFTRFFPWLMLNRAGLTVLIHPNTGQPRADHMVRAAWLGEVLPLKPDGLAEREDLSALDTEPNTQPGGAT